MTGCDDSSRACVRMIATMVVRVAGNSVLGIRIKRILFAFYLYVQTYIRMGHGHSRFGQTAVRRSLPRRAECRSRIRNDNSTFF